MQNKDIFSFVLFSQLNFDHLSIVSEENSEGNSIIQNEDSPIPMQDLSAFLHNVDVLSPLSYLQKLSKKIRHPNYNLSLHCQIATKCFIWFLRGFL